MSQTNCMTIGLSNTMYIHILTFFFTNAESVAADCKCLKGKLSPHWARVTTQIEVLGMAKLAHLKVLRV